MSTEPCQYPSARFVPRPRPGLFVDKTVVRAAIDTLGVRLINALTIEQHRGTGGVHYGRRGSIPGSVCVPARSLTEPTTHAYLPLERLPATFEAAGALDRSRAITYCGAALAACSDAFTLYRLGLEDISVYAASMQEWAQDLDCPVALP